MKFYNCFNFIDIFSEYRLIVFYIYRIELTTLVLKNYLIQLRFFSFSLLSFIIFLLFFLV